MTTSRRTATPVAPKPRAKGIASSRPSRAKARVATIPKGVDLIGPAILEPAILEPAILEPAIPIVAASTEGVTPPRPALAALVLALVAWLTTDHGHALRTAVGAAAKAVALVWATGWWCGRQVRGLLALCISMQRTGWWPRPRVVRQMS